MVEGDRTLIFYKAFFPAFSLPHICSVMLKKSWTLPNFILKLGALFHNQKMIGFNIRFFSWFKIQENGNSCCAAIRYNYHLQVCGYSRSSLFGYFFLVILYKLLDSKLCLTESIILCIKWEFPWCCSWVFFLITSFMAQLCNLVILRVLLTQLLWGHHLAEAHQAQMCSLQFIFSGNKSAGEMLHIDFLLALAGFMVMVGEISGSINL